MTQDVDFKENMSETAFFPLKEMLSHFAQVPQVLWSLPCCKEIPRTVRLLEISFSPLLIHSFSVLGFPSIKVI